jgi:hypothetical protein
MKDRFWFPARFKDGGIMLLEEVVWKDEKIALFEFASRFSTKPCMLMESRNGETCSPKEFQRGTKIVIDSFDVPEAIKKIVSNSDNGIEIETRKSIINTMPGWSKLTSAPDGFSLIESFYKTLLDGSTVCVSIYECGGWYHHVASIVESGYPDLIGLKPENIINRSVHSILHYAKEDNNIIKSKLYNANSSLYVENVKTKAVINEENIIKEALVGNEILSNSMEDVLRAYYCCGGTNALNMMRSWKPYREAIENFIVDKTKPSLKTISEGRVVTHDKEIYWGTRLQDKRGFHCWKMMSSNPVKDFMDCGSEHAYIEESVDAFEHVKNIILSKSFRYNIDTKNVKFLRPESYSLEQDPERNAVLFAVIKESELYECLNGFYGHQDYKDFSRELREELESHGFSFGMTGEAIYVSIVPTKIGSSCEEKLFEHGHDAFVSFSSVLEDSDEGHMKAFSKALNTCLDEKKFYIAPVYNESRSISGYLSGYPFSKITSGMEIGSRIAEVRNIKNDEKMSLFERLKRSVKNMIGINESANNDYMVIDWKMIGAGNIPIHVREGYDNEWTPSEYISLNTEQIKFEQRCPEKGEIIIDPRPFRDGLVSIKESSCVLEKSNIEKGRPNDHYIYDMVGEMLHDGKVMKYQLKPACWSKTPYAPVGFLQCSPENYYRVNMDETILEQYMKRHKNSSFSMPPTPMLSRTISSVNKKPTGFSFQAFIKNSGKTIKPRKNSIKTIEEAINEAKKAAKILANASDEEVMYEVFDQDGNVVSEGKGRPGGWIGPVYHGSIKKDLKTININASGTGIAGRKGRIKTAFFTSSKENALFYTDPKNEYEDSEEYVYICYINIKNPFVVDCDNEKCGSISEVAEKAFDNGHDGFVIKNIVDGASIGNTYGIFSNNQVRIIGPLKTGSMRLSNIDSVIDPEDYEIYGDDDKNEWYYSIIVGDQYASNDLSNGPFKSEEEAEKSAIERIEAHNKTISENIKLHKEHPLYMGLHDNKKIWKKAPDRVTATASSHPDADKLPIVGVAMESKMEERA